MNHYTVIDSNVTVYKGVSYQKALQVYNDCKKDPKEKCKSCPALKFEVDVTMCTDFHIMELGDVVKCPFINMVPEGEIVNDGVDQYIPYCCTGIPKTSNVSIECLDTDTGKVVIA